MTNSKRFTSFLLACTFAFSLLGCGGSGGGGGSINPNPMIQNASFQVTWPARSRAGVEKGSALVHDLGSALSATVTLKAADANGQDVTVAIDREASHVAAFTGTYLVGKPIKASVSALTAQFFAGHTEQGAVVGTASASIAASGSSLNLADIVLQGVIKKVGIVNPGPLTVGTKNVQLLFTTQDASGNTVAVTPGSAIWSISSGGSYLTLTKDGIGNAVAVGAAQVVATVDGVSSAQASITVVAGGKTGEYRLVPINTVAGVYNLGINASGEVAGNTLDKSGNNLAFVWTEANGVADLSLGSFQFPNNFTVAQAINDAGQIVGSGFHFITPGAGYLQPVFWPSGAATPVEPTQTFGSGNLNAGQTSLLGINNSGAMVGNTNTGFVNNSKATYWSSPNAVPVSLAQGSSAGSAAAAINSSGEIVGELQSLNESGSPTHACIWTSSSAAPTMLKELSGGTSSQAIAVNASGEIVGTETEASGLHVLLWTSSSATPKDLGLGEGLSPVVALNDTGTVVWLSISGTSISGGIYTPAGGIKDLNNLLDSSGAGYTIQSGSGVNNNGWIAGIAKGPTGQITPVVLIPNN